MKELNPINTILDVAAYLQVSESTIRRVIKRGQLKTITALGKVRITKKAVEEFVSH